VKNWEKTKKGIIILLWTSLFLHLYSLIAYRFMSILQMNLSLRIILWSSSPCGTPWIHI